MEHRGIEDLGNRLFGSERLRLYQTKAGNGQYCSLARTMGDLGVTALGNGQRGIEPGHREVLT